MRKPAPKPRIMSPEEALAILHAAGNSQRAEALVLERPTQHLRAIRRRAVLETLYWTGVRTIELTNLRPTQVEWPTKLNGYRCFLHLTRTKGDKPRIVPVPDLCLPWLQLWEQRSRRWRAPGS